MATYKYATLSEWSIVLAWKAGVLKGTAGSNPVRCAKQNKFKR